MLARRLQSNRRPHAAVRRTSPSRRQLHVSASAATTVRGVPGVLVIQGMSLRIPAGGLVISIGDDGSPTLAPVVPHLRLDLWPTWLEIGCDHTRRAHDTASAVSASMADQAKADLLGRELQDALVAMCAFAFAFDGFYDVVKSELGEHPDAVRWRQEGRRPTPRYRQLAETFRYHLKLGPQFTSQLRQLLKELFKFRDLAVHPSSSYQPATMRVDLDSGVHPHLITFSGKHAVQCRAIALVLFDRLVERATEVVPETAERGWIETGLREVARLAGMYRIPGDDAVAYPAENLEEEPTSGQAPSSMPTT